MKPLNKTLLSFKQPEFIGNLEKYKPNYKYLKCLAGLGLVGLCLITPATNWAILMIVPGFILQIPVNYDKFKETKIGKIYTKLKFKVLR